MVDIINYLTSEGNSIMKQSKWLTFILVAIAQFMVTLDISITNVALPTIKQQLHFTNSTLQWVITAYALTFGGFLLLEGSVKKDRRLLIGGYCMLALFVLLIACQRTLTAILGGGLSIREGGASHLYRHQRWRIQRRVRLGSGPLRGQA